MPSGTRNFRDGRSHSMVIYRTHSDFLVPMIHRRRHFHGTEICYQRSGQKAGEDEDSHGSSIAFCAEKDLSIGMLLAQCAFLLRLQ